MDFVVDIEIDIDIVRGVLHSYFFSRCKGEETSLARYVRVCVCDMRTYMHCLSACLPLCVCVCLCVSLCVSVFHPLTLTYTPKHPHRQVLPSLPVRARSTTRRILYWMSCRLQLWFPVRKYQLLPPPHDNRREQ